MLDYKAIIPPGDQVKELAAAPVGITLKRAGVFLGAEVRGVDLTQPISTEIAAYLTQAHAEHGVLVFPDQTISSEDLMRFGRCFGELSVHPFSTSTQKTPELVIYDNHKDNPPTTTDIWHTDETFRECPPMGTILCSKIIPDLGGDTNFACMSAIYESLSDRMQRFLSDLEAVHDFVPHKLVFEETKEGIAKLRHYEDLFPKVTHPVVRIHPVTGRKAIFVSPQFTLYIKGMDGTESKQLLESVYRRTLIHEFHYRHRWQPNMVVFWDNRSVQHSALHDYYPQRRKLDRITIAGDRPFGDPPADAKDIRTYVMPPTAAFKNGRPKRHFEQ